MRCPIIRIDTNQGVYGLGEVRDGASKNYALMLKRLVLNENPCDVDKIFRKIKQFGGHARQGGGVCGVEMALWDIAGKVYNAPAYQLLGGKFRDKVRCYADTTESDNPKVFAERLKKRVDEKGFTFLKMDLGVDLVEKIPGTVTKPLGTTSREFARTQHMFTGMELTPKGVDAMANYVAAVREVIGMDVPLAADHFGHIGVNSCIRLGRALEKYNMAWLEDMIPWQYTEQLKEIKENIAIPLLTGEDIYLKEPFETLCKAHAVDIIHPDLATSGGSPRNEKDRRHGAGLRSCDGDALRGNPDFFHGQRALRRSDRKLPRARASLCRRPMVGGSRARRQAAVQQRFCQPSLTTGPRSNFKRRHRKATPRSER